MEDVERLHALHPLPITVYALALSLSVFYQRLRYCRLPEDQEDALGYFDTGCKILLELRQTWEAAEPIATLAEKSSAALHRCLGVDSARPVGPRSVHERNMIGNAQRSEVTTEEGRQVSVSDNSNIDGPPALLNTLEELDASEVFGGMDDLSWMYLDPSRPIGFDYFTSQANDEQ